MDGSEGQLAVERRELTHVELNELLEWDRGGVLRCELRPPHYRLNVADIRVRKSKRDLLGRYREGPASFDVLLWCVQTDGA